MVDVREWVRGLFSEKGERRSDSSLPESPNRPEGKRAFAEGHNDFALALFGQLLRGSDNLFFSPFSIRTALMMTYAGARGETALQMGRALRFETSGETMHLVLAETIRRLNAAGGDAYEMTVASSLWGQDSAPLQAGFLDLLVRHYGSGVNLVDFCRSAEAARMSINQWVEDKTKQRIRELIASGVLGSDTRLVLVNAVYFKGMWAVPFLKDDTCPEPFFLEGGSKAQAPLMRLQEDMRHAQLSGFQAVDLDYQGGNLSMLVLLPDKRNGLRDLEGLLSARLLQECAAKMRVREVKLLLPKFRTSWGPVNLGDQLRTLGMPLAFTRSQADFSGINGLEPAHEDSLFISAVVHKAFVEVNEEGTEAAAATGVLMEATMSATALKPPPIPVFRADHPFLFAIRDRKSNEILFLGRMVDPTRET